MPSRGASEARSRPIAKPYFEICLPRYSSEGIWIGHDFRGTQQVRIDPAGALTEHRSNQTKQGGQGYEVPEHKHSQDLQIEIVCLARAKIRELIASMRRPIAVF